jgi:hypothetical protein
LNQKRFDIKKLLLGHGEGKQLHQVQLNLI